MQRNALAVIAKVLPRVCAERFSRRPWGWDWACVGSQLPCAGSTWPASGWSSLTDCALQLRTATASPAALHAALPGMPAAGAAAPVRAAPALQREPRTEHGDNL